MSFDISIQRNLVWEKARKSLMIHTMIVGWIPTQPVFSVKKDDILYVIEGKQRLTTIDSFIHDGFKLFGIPDTDDEGNPYYTQDDTLIENINGKLFSELPQEFKDNILDYSIQFEILDNITAGQIDDVFIRLNSGKALTPIELTRVKAKSKKELAEMAAHPLFPTIVTEAGMRKYLNEKIAIQTWSALNMDEVSFESNKINKMIGSADITVEEVAQVLAVFSKFQEVYETVVNKEGTPEELSLYKTVATRMKTPTHLLSLVPLLDQSIEKKIPAETLADWCIRFFKGVAVFATISQLYNDNAYSGTNNAAAVSKRFKAIDTDFAAFQATL